MTSGLARWCIAVLMETEAKAGYYEVPQLLSAIFRLGVENDGTDTERESTNWTR